MQKNILQPKLKTTHAAYFFWFILGSHYAYLGKWGRQILFWLTLGGFGIWALIDFFIMPNIVNSANAPIIKELKKLEDEKKADLLKRWQQ